MFYSSELEALEKRNILRERQIFSRDLKDFASNDYLNLSLQKKHFKKAYKLLQNRDLLAPRASVAINGYSKLHKMLETKLCEINGFERGMVLGSGFLGNIALFETLCRKNDIMFIDEEYHASGILASKLINNVVFFAHNDEKHLESLIEKNRDKNRRIIAIEGIYSMSGDVAKREFINIAKKYNAILIVDEAHSSGVLGKNLNGYFDFYDEKIDSNFIKLGTLSKAYGSYGAYILASAHIIKFLESRAKPVIYSTALGLFDVALALVNLKYIQKNKKRIHKKIARFKAIVREKLDIKLDSVILSIKFQDQSKMLKKSQDLKDRGFLVASIRKPTTKIPQLRVILSTKHRKKDIKKLCNLLRK